MDLEKFIGETNIYDKKEKLEKSKPKSWLKTVSAFSNFNGGQIIFGIKENDQIVGIENYKSDSEFISQKIKEKIEPIPSFDIHIIKIAEKHLLILEVFEGKNTPYFYNDSGTRTAYRRVGNETVVIDNIELLNLNLKGSNLSFEELSSNFKRKELEFSQLFYYYFKNNHEKMDDNDLNSFNLIDNKDFLTNAGLLFSDINPIYTSRIFCTRWNGLIMNNDRLDIIDELEINGGILSQLFDSIKFIKLNSKIKWKKADDRRIVYPDYPERAVQEAIVNAIVHRDYSQKGSEIHINIFDDRLEIYSPGGMISRELIQNLNIEKIPSKRRNPIIADIFSRLFLMERKGSGLKKILKAYEVQENYTKEFKPEFNSTADSFFVVLKNLNYASLNNLNQVSDNTSNKISKKDRLNYIISLKANKLDLSIDTLALKFNVSERTIKRDLLEISKNNL